MQLKNALARTLLIAAALAVSPWGAARAVAAEGGGTGPLLIVLGDKAASLEKLAAEDLRKYGAHVFDADISITAAKALPEKPAGPMIVIGQSATNAIVSDLAAAGAILLRILSP